MNTKEYDQLLKEVLIRILEEPEFADQMRGDIEQTLRKYHIHLPREIIDKLSSAESIEELLSPVFFGSLL